MTHAKTHLILLMALVLGSAVGLVMSCGGGNDDDRDDNHYNNHSCEDPDWRVLVDDQCRALVLHGTSLGQFAKFNGHPWVTREDVIAMSRDLGFNFVRYLIFWISVEPEPGVYDDAYLDEVAERMDWLAEAGINVVFDMHQDLWGPSLNSCFPEEIYNGAPAWATITDGLPNISGLCEFGWPTLYLSPDMIRAFDNFFDYEGDHPELQDHYAAMWAHVAERFKDHPAVLGYDLMNEPWHGADLFRAREFDETKMHGFIQRMIDAIRTVDNDSWIFFEPRAGGPNQGLPSYIPPLNDPRNGHPRLVYFPHNYPLSLLNGTWEPGAADVALWVKNRRAEVDVLKMPLAVGEWSWGGNPDYTIELLNYLDEMMAGWTQYAYMNGGFVPEEADVTVRVFPQRIAGRPLAWRYDPRSREFTLQFETQSGVTGPTEIYIPAARHFPDGWVLSVIDPEGAWSSQWDEDMEILRVFTDPAQAEHTISIRPAD